MNDKLFSIGEVAKLFHISISSLRHYENIGLLKPEYVDKKTGYRYYSVRQFEALNSIRYLRELNMPLDEISDFLSNRDVEVIEEKLKEQRQSVINKQKELIEYLRRSCDRKESCWIEEQHENVELETKLEEKNKIINAMAEYISKKEILVDKHCYALTAEAIKQYFKKQIK